MKRKRRPISILFAMLLVSMIAGCAGKAGFVKVSAIPRRDRQVTIETLKEKWKDYHISYNGVTKDQPKGLLFDPKDDDGKIVGKWWYPVEDEKTLADMISWIKAFSQSYPIVQKISGPNNQVFGYVYGDPNYQVFAKALDAKTVRIFELQFRRFQYSMAGP